MYYNLEHPDKNRVLKFWCIFARVYWTMISGFSHLALCYVTPNIVGLLPRTNGSHGLMPEDLKESKLYHLSRLDACHCQKIFTCETRVLHSTPQSLTYWLRRLPFFLMHAQAHEARACAERRPELIGHYRARKICIYFLPFFTYTSKYQNDPLFFDSDVT